MNEQQKPWKADQRAPDSQEPRHFGLPRRLYIAYFVSTRIDRLPNFMLDVSVMKVLWGTRDEEGCVCDSDRSG